MSDVNMPKLSDTMEEGTVLEWKKRDGQEVRKGDALAEIESDKASFEIEAEADGVLHVIVDSGQPVPVGQLIGRIGVEAPGPAEPAGPAAATAPEKASAPPPPPTPPRPGDACPPTARMPPPRSRRRG